MIRATITFTPTLHQRLVMASEKQRTTISEVVRNLLEKALKVEEEKHLEKMYQILSNIEAAGPKGIMDASLTIDEVLYGERGTLQNNHDQ